VSLLGVGGKAIIEDANHRKALNWRHELEMILPYPGSAKWFGIAEICVETAIIFGTSK
jgi:hypothetical protein